MYVCVFFNSSTFSSAVSTWHLRTSSVVTSIFSAPCYFSVTSATPIGCLLSGLLSVYFPTFRHPTSHPTTRSRGTPMRTIFTRRLLVISTLGSPTILRRSSLVYHTRNKRAINSRRSHFTFYRLPSNLLRLLLIFKIRTNYDFVRGSSKNILRGYPYGKSPLLFSTKRTKTSFTSHYLVTIKRHRSGIVTTNFLYSYCSFVLTYIQSTGPSVILSNILGRVRVLGCSNRVLRGTTTNVFPRVPTTRHSLSFLRVPRANSRASRHNFSKTKKAGGNTKTSLECTWTSLVRCLLFPMSGKRVLRFSVRVFQRGVHPIFIRK